MPELHTLILFMGASLLLNITPGPDMLFVMTMGLKRGKSKGLLAALGIGVGYMLHILMAIVGLSAILYTSSAAFSIVKICGASYLIYLGIRTLTSKGNGFEENQPKQDAKSKNLLMQGFLVSAFNPKVVVFFLAFLPQFVNSELGTAPFQIALFGFIFSMLATSVNCTVAYTSSIIAAQLRKNRKISQFIDFSSGLLFLGLGLKLFFLQPNQR